MKKETLRTAKKETIEKLRRLAIEQLRKGATIKEVSENLGVGQSTIKLWKKEYKQKGSKFFMLKKRGVKGGSKDFTSSQLRQIKNCLIDKLPDQLKLPFVLWDRKAVQALIFKKFGVKKSLPQIGRYLKTWGMSPQKPIYKAYEQNPEAVDKWLKKEFPKIKRKAKKEKAEIFFGDEAGIRSDHHSGKSYSIKGKTPVVKKTGQRFGLNMISAVSAKGGKRFMLYKGRFNSKVFISFLSQLIKKAKRKIMLIVDNYSPHKTSQVKQWLTRHKDLIEIFFLPPYSPELNPDELLNQDIKTNAVGKQRASNAHELRKNVNTHLKKLSTKKVMSFFQHKKTKYAA
jgi:transposase